MMEDQTFQQGRITIINGDALPTLCDLGVGIADALITDPPYSSGGTYGKDRSNMPSEKYISHDTKKKYPDFTGDNRDQRSYLKWCALWLSESLRIVRPGGMSLVFTDWRQLPTVTDALQCGGFTWRGVAVWDKTEAVRPQRGAFRNQAEYVIWGTNGPRDMSGPILPGIFRKMINPKEKLHLTGKPIDVMTWLVSITPEDALIIDPFMGSGTTAIACIRTGRRFIGIERSEEYFNIAAERISSELSLKKSA